MNNHSELQSAASSSRTQNPANNPVAHIVDSALRTVCSAQHIGDRQWRIAFSDRRWGIARIENSWLVLEATLERGVDAVHWRDPISCLKHNAQSLVGVVCSAEFDLQLRADIRLDSSIQGQPARCKDQIEENYHAIAASLGVQCQNTASQQTEALRTVDISTLCHDTVWPIIERENGARVFDLEVTRGYYQAAVLSDAGRYRLFVELASGQNVAIAQREATSIFLLRACNSIRRVCAIETVEKAFGFQIALTQSPSVTELTDALAALSVACSQFGEEVHALMGDVELAKAYLPLFESRFFTRSNTDDVQPHGDPRSPDTPNRQSAGEFKKRNTQE